MGTISAVDQVHALRGLRSCGDCEQNRPVADGAQRVRLALRTDTSLRLRGMIQPAPTTSGG